MFLSGKAAQLCIYNVAVITTNRPCQIMIPGDDMGMSESIEQVIKRYLLSLHHNVINYNIILEMTPAGEADTPMTSTTFEEDTCMKTDVTLNTELPSIKCNVMQ